MERASERARRRKKLPERRKREGEEGEGKKRIGRAKNRQRPGRKEGAENEGELRSASESLEASRSALSRWISSGQHRSLSFSLSPPFPGSPFDHFSHWDTKVERTKLAAISSRFRARSAERPYLHRTISWRGVEYRASTPGGISRAQR